MARPRPSFALSALTTALMALLVSTLGFIPQTAAEQPWWEASNRPAADSAINVTGEPFQGLDDNGRVRGFVDAHNHVMTNEAFGGKLICGKPFDQGAAPAALKDCSEHYPNGEFALFDQLTGSGNHNPEGWPTFKDWPSHDSLTHQQNYYAWIERSWRAGQRVMVTNLTTNAVICSILPAKDKGCDEMTSVRLQAQKTYDMQDYIDGVYGGPGRGFFRIVTTPEQAEEVIKAGKLAVVLGVETSEPFGCKQILGVPQCSKADIDRGLDELQNLGVSSMYLCHKFDNALCGVRFDSGTLGTIINLGQFISTGTYWQTEQCTGPQKDNPIGNAPVPPELEGQVPGGATPPTYPSGAQCNTRGLTDLGEYALRGMAKRTMMVEMDHMSVKAAGRAFDVLESIDYPGVLSTHSWMDAGFTERLYRLGGFAAAYDSQSQDFVANAAKTAGLRAKYAVGLGYGSDLNGLGGWPAPRGEENPTKVVYPYRSYDGGSVLDRQVTGQRTWDVNTDGVAHAGMIPDWIQDIRNVGGESVVEEMFRGAASYLDTWSATTEHTAPTNLASGARAQASSSEWSLFTSFAPSRAIDSNPKTRWASDWSDAEWISVDLRGPQRVGRVVLDWERAYAKAYRIEVSSDGTQWREVASTVTGRGGVETVRFTPTDARYVRMQGVTRGTKWGYSLKELGVYAR